MVPKHLSIDLIGFVLYNYIWIDGTLNGFIIYITGRNSMLFSSTTFLFVFLPLTLGIYYTLLRNNRYLQNLFLFIVSILFYAWGEPAFVFLMLLSITANYFFGSYIGTRGDRSVRTKIMLLLAVSFNLAILFVFKYLTFTLSNISTLFSLSWTVAEIALPIGISFFTFQAMSYVIDVYRGEQHQKNILNLGLYISFFPQLIAGPIVRYETIAKEISDRRETFSDFCDGVFRFIIGLGKKVLIANTMAVVADVYFNADVASLGVLSSWLGVVAYTFQIFFDFSGYSDMAIGLGKMFGFHFLENFDYPYISLSITEFWRRWHISLGTWFRDYLYFPLGGSRVQRKSRMVFNLLVVWLMTGIWHGANWTFVFWGLMYFVLLVTEKLTGLHKSTKFKAIRYIYTIFFVMIGWVIFRSTSISNAFRYIAVMFGSTGLVFDNSALYYLKENAVCFVLAGILSTPLIRWFCRKYLTNKIGQVVLTIALLLVFLLSVVYIVKGAYNPFIYFNF